MRNESRGCVAARTDHTPRPPRSVGAARRAPVDAAPRRRLTLLLALGCLLPVACGQAPTGAATSDGTDGGDGTTNPTLGSEALSDEELAALTTTTETEAVAGPETLPVGPPLEAGATMDDIRATVESLHGPTDDLSGQMGRLVSFPQVPTPAGAYITEVRADARETLDGSAVVVVAEVTFDADGSPEELIEQFASQLTGQGWLLTGRHGRSATAGSAHRATFEIPDTSYQLDDVSVLITDPPVEGAAGRRSEVLLRYVELQPIGSETARQRYQDWAAAIPLPADGQITGAGIQTSSIGRHSLHFTLALRYPTTGPDAIAGSLRADLPGAGFEVLDRPVYDDKLDNWVYLRGEGLDDAWVSTHAVETGPDAGSTAVNVDARIGFVPEALKS